MAIAERMAQARMQRLQAGYWRQRVCVEEQQDGIIRVGDAHYLNFSSNDYLGLNGHPAVLQAWAEGLARFGAGSGASPLVTGYTQAHQALEMYLADGLGRESVLLFNSGFAANQAICQALCSSETQLIADKLMHASFIDGAQASDGRLRRFRHNDMVHLSQLLAGSDASETLVATEGVFSMDGDTPPLHELIELVSPRGAWLMLDDAHGFGVLGEKGMGCIEHFDLSQQQLPVYMATLGKAVGTAGAFVAGSHALIEHLVNFARHYVYSTALPPAQAWASLAALRIIRQDKPQQQLQQNIQRWRQLALQEGLPLLNSTSAIQPVIVGCPVRAAALSEGLAKRGIWAKAIRYPTVPKGSDRLRFTLSAAHRPQDIDAAMDALVLAWRECPSV